VADVCAASAAGSVPPARLSSAVAVVPGAGPAIGSLCTGYGGLDLAVLDVLGGHLAWVAENSRGAAAILAARFPGVPNLGDLTRVDWASVPPVDVVTAGFPCQDISCAGRRAGIEKGTRSGVWLHIAQALGLLRPVVAFVENVAALRSRGLGRVLADLAALGYDTQWASLRASDIGAAHRRDRIFILAWQRGAVTRLLAAAHSGGGELQRRGIPGFLAGPPYPAESPAPQRQRGQCATGHRCPAAAHSPCQRLGHGRPPPRCWVRPSAVGGALAHSPCHRRHQGQPESAGLAWRPDTAVCGSPDWGPFQPAIERWGTLLGRAAPPPTEPGGAGQPRLSARFVEWLMGLPEGWVTGSGISRGAQLHALGNGVVPQQAAAAMRLLIEGGTRFASLPGPPGRATPEITA
jgi:DNA (cytosine-5)-methyltransferase 1